ncbi:hypothetical protein Bca101_017671 [Brassica carinata]
MSHVYPAENMLNEGMPVSSHWNSSTGPNAYTAPGHGVERQHHNPGTSGPSHIPYMSSAVATFSAPQETYVTSASSSNCNSQTWSNDSYLPMENMRRSLKRKAPYDSSIYEMGSSSHYQGDRASSDIPFTSELHMGKSISHCQDPHYMPWLMDPSYRSNNLSIRGESSSRNVRTRHTLDLETSVDRNNLSRSSGLDSHPTHHNVEHFNSGQFPGQAKDWNCPRLSPVPGGKQTSMVPLEIQMSLSTFFDHIDSHLADINGFIPETNNFLPTRSVVNSTSVDTSGYHQGVIGNRNSTASHCFPGTSTQAASSSRFSHRSTPTYRSSSNGLRLGHVASSSADRSHLVNETYPSRHLRPPPHISWRSSGRPGRRRSSYERFQPHIDEVALHERFSSQELLALGERIGSVNTGLSNNTISSCLLETTYYPLYQTDEQRKCAICLEEYKEGEELGELKGCGHDYHGGCIKKWLSMKNSCPICKSPALPDASSKNP